MSDGAESGHDFGAWVAPHLVPMSNLAARLVGASERDDVVQEALTRAWRKRHTFDSRKGTPRVWLLAIVADRSRRFHQRNRGVRPLGEPSVSATDGSRIDVERAVASLPPRMRSVVDCFYFVDLTVAETARVMGISEGTVKSTLADARERLRPLLEETP